MLFNLLNWMAGAAVVRELQVSPFSGLVATVKVGTPAQRIPIGLQFRHWSEHYVTADCGHLNTQYSPSNSRSYDRFSRWDRIGFAGISSGIRVYNDERTNGEICGLFSLLPGNTFFRNKSVTFRRHPENDSRVLMEVSGRRPEADFWLRSQPSARWDVGSFVIDLSQRGLKLTQREFERFQARLGGSRSEVRDYQLFVDCTAEITYVTGLGEGRTLTIPNRYLMLPAEDESGLCPTRISRSDRENHFDTVIGTVLLEAVEALTFEFSNAGSGRGNVGFRLGQNQERPPIAMTAAVPLFDEPRIDAGNIVFPPATDNSRLLFINSRRDGSPFRFLRDAPALHLPLGGIRTEIPGWFSRVTFELVNGEVRFGLEPAEPGSQQMNEVSIFRTRYFVEIRVNPRRTAVQELPRPIPVRTAIDPPPAATPRSPDDNAPAARPASTADKINSCAVCLSEFEEGERIQGLRRCTHEFHHDCIVGWLRRGHLNCPMCRSAVAAADPLIHAPIDTLSPIHNTQA